MLGEWYSFNKFHTCCSSLSHFSTCSSVFSSVIPITETFYLNFETYKLKISPIHNHRFLTFWRGDAICWHRSGPTLTQVRGCCLRAPSHYLNQCWLIIKGVLWHSRESDIIVTVTWYHRQHRSGSTLAQTMVCCLKIPRHYLNQCKVQWASSEGNFTRDTSAISH